MFAGSMSFRRGSLHTTGGAGEPNLFRAGRWRGTPIDGALDDLAHASEPKSGAVRTALRPFQRRTAVPVQEREFQL